MDRELQEQVFDMEINNLARLHQEQVIAVQEESVERRLLIAREGLRFEGWENTELRVFIDGTDESGTPMWCALVGPDLQVGHCAFHIQKLRAKELLLIEIENPKTTTPVGRDGRLHPPDSNQRQPLYEIYTHGDDFIAVDTKTRHESIGESMLDSLMHLECDLREMENKSEGGKDGESKHQCES